jgi:two-component system sensor histidine kinase CpxA
LLHDEPHRLFPPDDRRFMLHDGGLYWVVMHIRIPAADGPPRPEPLILIAVSKSLTGGGLFFDLTAWLIGAVAIVTLSALFWVPLVSGITHSISRMTAATEKIAEGNFEVRAGVRRRDELGQLSDAINRMADRLAGFVTGQKRFLGDIAHELTSPIARTQVALAILEQRADPAQKEYLADLREEVEQMSALVNELLSFSKASIGGAAVKLQPVPLRALCQKAADRECPPGSGEIQNHVPEDLVVQADPDLLARAIGNILRNAIHYAAKAGPIIINAQRTSDHVQLTIDDSGPGIPEEALPRVFDPFYRVDTSRTRETGGVGLGLSIVKTCIQTCSGAVHCENRQPHGLRVVVQLGNEQNKTQSL